MDKIIELNKKHTDTLLYTIYDILAEKYGNIFESQNEATASRQFKNFLNEIPEDNRNDFQLVRLGYFDRSQCKIIPLTEGNILLTKEALENGTSV